MDACFGAGDGFGGEVGGEGVEEGNEFVGRGGGFAGHVEGGEDKTVGDGEEGFEHDGGVFDFERAEEEGGFLAGVDGLYAFDEGGHFVGVVCAVEEDGGGGAGGTARLEDFHASGELERAEGRRGEGVGGRKGEKGIGSFVIRDSGFVREEEVEGSEGEGGVEGLEFAAHGDLDVFVGVVGGVDGEGRTVAVEVVDGVVEVFAETVEGDAFGVGFGLEDGEDFGFGFGGDGEGVFFNNARFVPGDVGEGGADLGFVIHADVGDDGEARGDEVGGVVASAHGGFDDGPVYVLAGEPAEGEGGPGFFVAEAFVIGVTWVTLSPRVVHGAKFVHGFDEGDRGDHVAVEEEFFVGELEVGANVRAGFVAHAGEQGGEHDGDGAFAARSGDVDGGVTGVRVAGEGEEVGHAGDLSVKFVLAFFGGTGEGVARAGGVGDAGVEPLEDAVEFGVGGGGEHGGY